MGRDPPEPRQAWRAASPDTRVPVLWPISLCRKILLFIPFKLEFELGLQNGAVFIAEIERALKGKPPKLVTDRGLHVICTVTPMRSTAPEHLR